MAVPLVTLFDCDDSHKTGAGQRLASAASTNCPKRHGGKTITHEVAVSSSNLVVVATGGDAFAVSG